MKGRVRLLLAFGLALLMMVFVAAGCGTSKEAENNANTPGTETKADYPKNPVKIVVARKAGGSTDVVARMLQPLLQKHLGTNVIVENVEGAGGKIGNSQVFKAAPDGYTLLMGVFPSDVLTSSIEGGTDYKMTDFIPIYNVQGGEASAVVVPYDSKYQTLKDLVDAAKKAPGKLNAAMPAGLSNSSLGYALLAGATGVQMEIVPFDGGNAALQAVMGGHVDVTVANSMNTYKPVKDKKIRVLATFAPKEDSQLPGVPTFASLYGAEYAYATSTGIMAPPGTPDDIVKILETALDKAVNDPEFAKNVGKTFTVDPLDSAAFKQSIKGSYDLAEKFRSNLEKFVEKKK